jgi:hypothetical protein
MTPPDRATPGPDGYAALHRGLHWQVPAHFNIAQACSAA